MQSRVANGDKENLVDVKKVLVIGSGGLVRLFYSRSFLESCAFGESGYHEGANIEVCVEHWAGGRI